MTFIHFTGSNCVVPVNKGDHSLRFSLNIKMRSSIVSNLKCVTEMECDCGKTESFCNALS